MSNFVKKAAVAVMSLFFAISSVRAAFAHNFILTPDKFGAAVGESAGIAATFTHEVGKGQYPVFSLTAEHDDTVAAMLGQTGKTYVGVFDGSLVISADLTGSGHSASFKVHYNNGQEILIPEASSKPYDLDTGKVTDSRVADSDYATFSISQAGTAAVAGDIKMALNIGFMTGGLSMSAENVAYSKTFLNLTNDGMAAKKFGGNDVMEIVFAKEVPEGGIKVGDTVQFQVLHKGRPLANAEVHASYIGAEAEYGGPGIGWENDDSLGKSNTDSDGFVAFTFDHASGSFVGLEYADPDDGRGYTAGVMFDVAGGGSGNPSGGGCDAGATGLLAIGLVTLGAWKKRK
jgi:uncharacterized GH25 family protein